MKVVFMSLTGQTRKFVNKLGFETMELTAGNPFQKMEEPFIIVAPTYDKEVTDILVDFIETDRNRSYFKGVAGGGNLNFGKLFGFTAKDLSRDYGVPLLHLFEFQGNEKDIQILKEKVTELG